MSSETKPSTSKVSGAPMRSRLPSFTRVRCGRWKPSMPSTALFGPSSCTSFSAIVDLPAAGGPTMPTSTRGFVDSVSLMRRAIAPRLVSSFTLTSPTRRMLSVEHRCASWERSQSCQIVEIEELHNPPDRCIRSLVESLNGGPSTGGYKPLSPQMPTPSIETGTPTKTFVTECSHAPETQIWSACLGVAADDPQRHKLCGAARQQSLHDQGAPQ